MAHDETRKGLKGKRRAPSANRREGEPTHASSSALDEDLGGKRPGKQDPERKCVLSGGKAPREELIRLALSPDGIVAPDIRAKAPGRGAWIGVDRVALEAAIVKGKLKGALNRAFKSAAIVIPDDLPQQIEAALQRAALDRLGLEARAGTLVTGTERIAEAARKGTVDLLLHAKDAAVDGSRKLDQALRVGLGIEGSGEQGVVIPASRAILSMAVGRENVVHIALIAPAAAARVSHALGRWRSFIGLGDDGEPCETPSQGPSAHEK
jgi:predicted RNA-binding protein YlxR (DUF448 family)